MRELDNNEQIDINGGNIAPLIPLIGPYIATLVAIQLLSIR